MSADWDATMDYESGADRDPVAVDAAEVLAGLQDEMFCECGVTHIITMKPEATLAALDAAGFDVLPRGQFRDPEGQVWQAMFRDTGMFWWKKVPVAGEGSTDGE